MNNNQVYGGYGVYSNNMNPTYNNYNPGYNPRYNPALYENQNNMNMNPNFHYP